MPVSPNRLTVTLDADSLELLRRIEKITAMSPSATLTKLLSSHLGELWTYVEWFEQLPDDAASKALQHRARYLPQNYGPGSLIDDIKELDPTYQTPAEKLAEQVTAARKGDAK